MQSWMREVTLEVYIMVGILGGNFACFNVNTEQNQSVVTDFK